MNISAESDLFYAVMYLGFRPESSVTCCRVSALKWNLFYYQKMVSLYSMSNDNLFKSDLW